MVFFKGLLGGVAAAFIMWLAIVLTDMYLTTRSASPKELGAVAGGWTYLIQLPLVVLLLSGAFGAGLLLTVKLLLPRKP
jgi:hypothetical protein